ncbi:hypothetical protein NKH17_06745 [Mesorhizobium sp. M1334]|uniref:hypothetical protein n=1 Tax=Mesorhizobium sp. M1334 TaxID=2957084 RepID=UPI003335CBA6
MAVSSNSTALPNGKNLSRRSILGGLAIASVGGVAAVSAQRDMTAHERYEHHLAELKKAAEEIDPRISHWDGFNFLGDEGSDGCGMMISAHFRTGRYQGDGIYETEHSGPVKVTLLADRRDGKRMFAYSWPNGRHEIPEDRLEAFIVRKVV